MKKLWSVFWKEPLVRFLLVGIVLAFAFELTSSQFSGPNREIVISEPQVIQMASQFAKRYRRPPTEPELNGLLNTYIQNEIYYREGLSAGLDQNDQIVRRRLRQKLETLMDDASSSRPPSNQELIEYLRSNEDRYAIEGSVPDLQDVRPLVEADWLAARRGEAKAAAISELREKYEVTIQWPDSLGVDG
jgi:hypothetical protein